MAKNECRWSVKIRVETGDKSSVEEYLVDAATVSDACKKLEAHLQKRDLLGDAPLDVVAVKESGMRSIVAPEQ